MIWVSIPDLPGYKANQEGQLLSLKGSEPRILKTKFDKRRGYLRVRLHKDGWSREFDVHQLIALAFLGPRPEGYHVCHNDGNKLNNRAGNLRYDTPAANSADSMKHGTSPGVAIAARTKCNHGHEFTPENTYFRPARNNSGKTYRLCRRCQIDRTMACHKRRKQGLTPTPWVPKAKPKPRTEAEWDAYNRKDSE